MIVNTPTLSGPQTMRPTPMSLAAALSEAIICGDSPLAVQLAWRLIFQPDCPLRLQVHAVLVHSALSLRLGGRAQLIESNLRATVHRLAGGTELARLATRGHLVRWKLEALGQLHAALRSLRLYGEIPFRVHGLTLPRRPSPSAPTGHGTEHLVEGMGNMELERVADVVQEDVVLNQEVTV